MHGFSILKDFFTIFIQREREHHQDLVSKLQQVPTSDKF